MHSTSPYPYSPISRNLYADNVPGLFNPLVGSLRNSAVSFFFSAGVRKMINVRQTLSDFSFFWSKDLPTQALHAKVSFSAC
jgi:hypothetical protein